MNNKIKKILEEKLIEKVGYSDDIDKIEVKKMNSCLKDYTIIHADGDVYVVKSDILINGTDE